MSLDPTINLGNVLTGIGTVGGILWAYHSWDKKVELRHQANKFQIENIDQKVNRIEAKLDENTKTTNGMDSRVIEMNVKIEKHISTDDVVQKEILRRLDNIDNDH
jgi:hypothetical protein